MPGIWCMPDACRVPCACRSSFACRASAARWALSVGRPPLAPARVQPALGAHVGRRGSLQVPIACHACRRSRRRVWLACVPLACVGKRALFGRERHVCRHARAFFPGEPGSCPPGSCPPGSCPPGSRLPGSCLPGVRSPGSRSPGYELDQLRAECPLGGLDDFT